MQKREQEVMSQLAEAKLSLKEARSVLSDAKKRWVDAETQMINAKLRVEALTEELRLIKVQTVIPGQQYDLYDDEG